jgi:nitric oxide reductase subunit C
MIVRIWIVFVVLFFCYSALIYLKADDKNLEGKPDELVMAGWHTWQSKNCQACHQLYGLGGYMGPDLTNTISDPLKGPLYMEAFIRKGTNKMPDFHLNDSEVSHLIRFLSWVDKSGRSRVGEASVNWSGTYTIEHK